MASSKRDRASMREGPLAALFRATDEAQSPEASGPLADAVKAASVERADPPESLAPVTAAAREYPHPGLASTDEPADERRAIPTPSERLRHAFSSEIEAETDDVAPAVVAPRTAPAPPSTPRRIETDVLSEGRNVPPADTPIAPPHVPPKIYESDPFARSESPSPWGEAKAVGQPVLRVVGVGGAGVNAVNRMVEAGIDGVEFIAINTDVQSLQQSTADVTLHIGPGITRGLGAGSNPELGRASAMEEYDKIKALLKGADMVFIAAGAGGGTGTGAAPIVARIAKELGALTVGIVTKPFGFEGVRRSSQAEVGIQSLSEEVDTLIVVPNNRLLAVLDKKTSMVDAFRVADDVLRQGVQGISDLVTLPGLINLDFADVRTIMSDAGNALLGIGMGTGEDRAVDAARHAVASPLLETSMEGARKILLSITSGTDLSLWEVNEAAKAVAEAAHPDANIIFGAMVDERLDDQVWVTVVATGFSGQPQRVSRRLQEPAGEPRVERRLPPAAPTQTTRRTGLGVTELDVPEFIPRG